MDEFIKLLDPILNYVSHELTDDTIIIRVSSNKEKAVCPFRGFSWSKKHMI